MLTDTQLRRCSEALWHAERTREWTDVILAGSFVKAIPFGAGDSIAAQFDQLGEVSLRFTA